MSLISAKLLRFSLVTRPLLQLQNLRTSLQRGFSEGHASLSSTLFVGRLPFDASEDELKTHFPRCVTARIIKDKFSGISKGFGYVDFHNHEDAREALSSDVIIQGRQIVLDMAESLRPSEIRDDPNMATSTLFVGRIPYSLTKEELQELFPGCSSARIMSDPDTGFSKGYGFVVYQTVEEAQEALKYNGLAVKGQRLNVNFASSTQSSDVDDAAHHILRRGDGQPSSTLFIKNLWYKTAEADLKSRFDGCTRVRVPMEQDSDGNRGFGYVEYASVEEAQSVFDKPENIVLDGRVLYIDYASDPMFSEAEKYTVQSDEDSTSDGKFDQIRRGNSDPSPRLFVRNLWYGTTEEALKSKFDGCVRVNIPIDPRSGSNKGYGFVEYDTVAEAQSVFDKSENVEVDGRVLYIDYSTGHGMKNESTNYDDGAIVRRGHNKPSSTLFLRNIWFDTTVDDLKAAFVGCTNVKLPLDLMTGKNKGFAFVDFATTEEAQSVFDKPENIEVGGRILYVDYASRSIDGDVSKRGTSLPSSTLFVKNLWYGTTEESLKGAFDNCLRVRIPIDPDTNLNKGFGFVQYANIADAQSVFDEKDDVKLDGHALFIDFAASSISSNHGGWEKELEIDRSNFYEGINPATKQETTADEQGTVDADVTMATCEDAK